MDVTAVAWLLDEKFMEDRYEHSPVFEYDNCYGVDLRVILSNMYTISTGIFCLKICLQNWQSKMCVSEK